MTVNIVLAVLLLIAVIIVVSAIKIIPQASAGIVERLGKYHRTLEPGLNLIVPGIDRLRPLVDLREKVVSFPPQPVITEDNLVVNIDTVIYFQVTNAKSATYEIENYIQGIEQLVIHHPPQLGRKPRLRKNADLARSHQYDTSRSPR
jgi:regulator of protease activity HflC (stomatin/prohibitin superfamily)